MKSKTNSAFTLIEVLLVISILALVFSFTSINLIKPQVSASLETTINTLVSDLKEQQIKSMVGDSEGVGIPSVYGIRFESDRYILFRNSYSAGEPSNFTIDLDEPTTIISFPPAQEIIFLQKSGEARIPGSLVIRNNQSSQQKTITINKIGAISVN